MTDDFPSIRPDDAADPIEDMLRRLTGEPAPTHETINRGMTRLQAVMDGGAVAADRRSVRWLRPVAAVALAGVVALTATLLASDEVTALDGLAEVAESVEPMVGGDGDFVHRTSDETVLAAVAAVDVGRPAGQDLLYHRRQQTRTWEDANQVRQEVEVLEPVFFGQQDEAAYLASPAASEPGRVEVTETARVPSDLDARAWSSDPARLRAEMEAYVSNEPDDTEVDVRLLGLAASLLRDPRITAPLRSALVRVIDGLEDIEVTTADGQVIASLRHRAPPGGTAVTSLVFDRGARLVEESQVWVDGRPEDGIPPGTVLYDYRYGVPEVVTGID